MIDFSKYKLDVQRSPLDLRDFIVETIHPVGDEELLPDNLDLTYNMRQVKDQGSQGSCSAQVAAQMKEWQERIDVGLREQMSAQFIYNNRSNQGTWGMTPKDTMEILYKIGIVHEDQYWYGKIEPAGAIDPKLYEEAAKYKISGYAQILTIDGLKKSLYKNGPCYLAVPVYNYGLRMWKPIPETPDLLGGHALCIVGYKKTEGFLIRNSWGIEWGDFGHTVFPYEDWGCQWETWSTIDAETGDPIPNNRKGCLLWWYNFWH